MDINRPSTNLDLKLGIIHQLCPCNSIEFRGYRYNRNKNLALKTYSYQGDLFALLIITQYVPIKDGHLLTHLESLYSRESSSQDVFSLCKYSEYNPDFSSLSISPSLLPWPCESIAAVEVKAFSAISFTPLSPQKHTWIFCRLALSFDFTSALCFYQVHVL